VKTGRKSNRGLYRPLFAERRRRLSLLCMSLHPTPELRWPASPAPVQIETHTFPKRVIPWLQEVQWAILRRLSANHVQGMTKDGRRRDATS